MEKEKLKSLRKEVKDYVTEMSKQGYKMAWSQPLLVEYIVKFIERKEDK